jgi:gliding motility-associated-like protein
VANGSNNQFTITPGTLTNAEIIIYQGGCPNTGTLQTCSVVNGSSQLTSTWGMTAGSQVWVGVASNGGVSGTFNLCIKSTPPPAGAGNTCASAVKVCTTPFVQNSVAFASGQSPACFGNAPQQDVFIKFTITQAGLLKWTATPNVASTEFDWALWDITNGCPGTLACCNYNYAAGSTSGFGMQAQAGTVTCGTSSFGSAANEFCGPMNVTCGKTYAIQISNYDNTGTGFSLSFAGSTALISSNAAFSITSQTLVCGSSLNTTINNTSTGACGEVWNYGDGSPTYTGTAPPAHTYTAPGTYAITANIGGACPSSATQFVQLLAPLAATAVTSSVTCFGNCTGTAAVSSVTGGDGMYTYLWNTGSTTSSITNLCAGPYTVTVSNAKCNSSVPIAVNIASPTQVSLTANPVIAACGGNNGSISLTGSGGTPGYTYNMNGGAYSATSTYNNLAAGVYTMGVKDSKNCQANITVTIITSSSPTVVATSATACAGSPATITASGANTYSWIPSTGLSSTTGSNVSATPAATSNYTVIGSIGGCTASAVANVLVNPLPVPTATNTGPYCDGATVNMSTGAFSTYTWSGPSSFSSGAQNPSIGTSSVANTGIYTVTVSDANGCIASATTSITVNAIPVPTVGSNSPVCLNNSINLAASGGTGYSWAGPNSFSSVSQNPTIPGATTLQAGTYSVTVTSSGCSAVGTVSVAVNTPTTSAAGGGPYCAGDVIQLTTPGATSYTWTGPSAFASNLQNPTRPNATPGMSGIYTVVVSIGSCTASATTSLTVNALPTPVVNNTGPVCIGKPVALSATGGTLYAWNGPAGFTSSAQNPSIAVTALNSAGVYTATVTDANNCVNTGVTTLSINSQPIVNATGTTVCENSNAQLNASGGVSYSWAGPGGFASGIQNPVIANATPTSSGIYTVIVTDANTCTNTAVANVIVNPAPVVNVNSNSPVCLNSVLSLNATGGINYLWSGPGTFASILQSPTVVVTSTAMAGVYTVTVAATGGCTGTANLNVIINPLPTLSLTSGPNKGCAPLCVTYSLQSSPTAASVSWNFGNGLGGSTMNPMSCYNSTGVYSISANVTDVNGCQSVVGYTAEVYPKPTADFVYSPVKPIENADMVTFTDISYGTPISSWNWYFLAGGQSTSAVQNPDFLYKDAGIYPIVLIVKSDHGCIDTVLKTITVIEDFGIWVPNAFTPNGDGVNDTFGPKGFGVVKYNLQIFDRWGESIFYTDDFYHQWPGTYQGRGDKICQDGVYTWRINAMGINGKNKEMIGHVTLLK